MADLDEADRIAVLTAVSKGAWRGILRGVALYSHAFNEQADAQLAEDPGADVTRVETTLHVDPEPDVWATRYGSEA
jgi:hypothetical protein